MLGERELIIDIPAGIADGQQMRISGKGEAAPRGGVPGDLYVTVHVQVDKHLDRRGDDVHSQVSLSFSDAALGTKIPVETIAGTRELTIPAGTQPGQAFTLRGEGFPQLGGSRHGDHIVTVTVEVPKKLSRQQKKLLQEFDQAKKKRSLFS